MSVLNLDINSARNLKQIADGNSGVRVVNKFGRNPSVGTSFIDIWNAGGSYNWLTAADTVRVKAGGDANDTAAGSGARTVTIVGLNENWSETEETVTLAGATASASTSTTFIRVFRAYVATCGSYGGTNAGVIVIETTSGTTVAQIDTGKAQTQLGLYTVPAGFTAFLAGFSFGAGNNKDLSADLFQRRNADQITAPYTAFRLVEGWDENRNLFDSKHVGMPDFPEKTDLVWRGKVDAGTGSASVTFTLILVAQ